MSEKAVEKKPGPGSYAEPIVLIILAAVVGMCSGHFIGGRVGGMSLDGEDEKKDPAAEGRELAMKATMETDKRLKRALQTGVEKGKAKKLRELEAELEKLAEDDKNIWNTTIEQSAINSCTSFYMKGINDGGKDYEKAFRWEYQVPKCKEGILSTKLSERLQLYHGKIPVGSAYEREISEELWGDCERMSKHYIDTLKRMKQLNINQNVEWKVEKKEITVTRD